MARQDSTSQHLSDEAHDAQMAMLAAIEAMHEAEAWRDEVAEKRQRTLDEIDDEAARAFSTWKEAHIHYLAMRENVRRLQ